MKTGNQIESQPESFSPMAVAFAQYPKYLQPPNHVLNLHPPSCQLPIRLLFRFAQAMQFAVFQRQNHIQTLVLQTPIAQITSQPNLFAKFDTAFLIQLIIVRFAFAKEGRNDFSGFFRDYQLRLQTEVVQ